MKTLSKQILVAVIILAASAHAAVAASSTKLVLRLHDSQGRTATVSLDVDGSHYTAGSTPSPLVELHCGSTSMTSAAA